MKPKPACENSLAQAVLRVDLFRIQDRYLQHYRPLLKQVYDMNTSVHLTEPLTFLPAFSNISQGNFENSNTGLKWCQTLHSHPKA